MVGILQVPGVTPVLSWGTYHGMDKVWNRIQEDNILRPFQSARVLQMVEDLFLGPDQIKNQDVRFLEMLLKKLEKSNPTSFTVLALSQLLATIEANGLHKLDSASNDPWAPRLASKPPRTNPVREILPEYYITTSNYTKDDVDRMLDLVTEIEAAVFVVALDPVWSQAPRLPCCCSALLCSAVAAAAAAVFPHSLLLLLPRCPYLFRSLRDGV